MSHMWAEHRRVGVIMSEVNLKIRHNVSHAVTARVVFLKDNGLILKNVFNLDGRCPFIGDLLGYYPDKKTLRSAIIKRLKESTEDRLDDVTLSDQAYFQWQVEVVKACQDVEKRGVIISEIPDVRARELRDGTLVIWVDLSTNERVQLLVPADQWNWK